MADTSEIREKFWLEYEVVRGWQQIEDVYPLLKGRGYISGSYAAYMCAVPLPMRPNDIDIFAVSNEAAGELVLELCRELPARMDLIQGPTVTIHRHRGGMPLPIQIINPHPTWSTFPDDILEWFDLDVSRAVLVAPDKILGDKNLGQQDGKLLRISDPLRSLKRIMKYHRRDVQFNDWELLKLFQAWDLLSAEQKSTLLDTAHEAAFPPEEDLGPVNDEPFYDIHDGYRFD